jgi:hypothetical protein
MSGTYEIVFNYNELTSSNNSATLYNGIEQNTPVGSIQYNEANLNISLVFVLDGIHIEYVYPSSYIK